MINIITRSASDTTGTLAQLELRNPSGSDLTLRHGEALADNSSHWRVHGRIFDGDGLIDSPTRGERTGEQDGHFGLRVDRELANGDTLRLEGEAAWGAVDQYQRATAPDRIGIFEVEDRDEFERLHLLADWSRHTASGGE